MTLKIVTDSTADIPEGVARTLGITVVPLNVHFGAEVYKDGRDLSSDEFFRRLIAGPVYPTTSQPSAGDFAQTYSNLAQQTDEILSIHISSKVSGTYNSALLGRDLAEKTCRVEVIDSLQISMGLGLVVIAAARAAAQGARLDEAAALTREIMPKVRTVCLMDTLEYLRRGGRIGRAQAFLGSLLNVKPMIKIEDGEVHPWERVRSRAKAIDRLYEFVAGLSNIKDLSILYSTTLSEARGFAQRLAPFFPPEQTHMAQFGPVIGTYTGPGALGVALIEG